MGTNSFCSRRTVTQDGGRRQFKIKVVYSDAYEVDIGAHVFPTAKFRLIKERILREGLIPEQDFVAAACASTEQILLIHTKSYLNKLNQGDLSPEEFAVLELPYSRALVRASKICVGGTILAAKLALRDRICVHLGGGFHHAFAGHGEGFCLLNDVAVAVEFCRLNKKIEKILIVDCDLHQGNGNAAIFKDNRDVFTFSIHQQNNYPLLKPPSDLDIGLADGAGDEEYLGALKKRLPQIVQDFRPRLIFYIAGADPYLKDQLGGLRLSQQGLAKRDQFVFALAERNQASVAVVFAGGYAVDINDTVAIHYNTAREALKWI